MGCLGLDLLTILCMHACLNKSIITPVFFFFCDVCVGKTLFGLAFDTLHLTFKSQTKGLYVYVNGPDVKALPVDACIQSDSLQFSARKQGGSVETSRLPSATV